MKIHMKTVWIIVLCLSIVVLIYRYKYIQSQQFDETSFPLKPVWTVLLNKNIQEICAGSGNTILVRTADKLYAYDSISGSLVWSSAVQGQVISFPPVTTAEAAFVSDDTKLWAFDLNTGKMLWTDSLDGASSWIPDASERFVLLNSISDTIYVYDSRSGKRLWATPGGRGFTPAHIDDNTVYIVDRAIKAFDITTGNVLWQVDNNRATGISAFADGSIYFIEYPGAGTIDLVAYSVESRSELWRVHFEENDPKGIYVFNDKLFFAKNDALLMIDTSDGKIEWQRSLSAPSNLAFGENSVYVLEQFNRRVDVFAIESGREIGYLQLSHSQAFAREAQEMVIVDNRLFLSKGRELIAFAKK